MSSTFPSAIVAGDSASAGGESAAPAAPSSSSSFLRHLGNLGLGYAVAVSLCFIVLLSTLLLASYVCCRLRHRNSNHNPSSGSGGGGGSSNGIALPRVIFVAEGDDEDDEEAGGAAATGLDQVVINSYPKFPFSAAKGGDNLCSICLCEYREGEMLRMMPDCRHAFHLPCIDAWLRLNASCPVCRTSPMPTPLSTPLSEVVPLSQYAADRRRR